LTICSPRVGCPRFGLSASCPVSTRSVVRSRTYAAERIYRVHLGLAPSGGVKRYRVVRYQVFSESRWNGTAMPCGLMVVYGRRRGAGTEPLLSNDRLRRAPATESRLETSLSRFIRRRSDRATPSGSRRDCRRIHTKIYRRGRHLKRQALVEERSGYIAQYDASVEGSDREVIEMAPVYRPR